MIFLSWIPCLCWNPCNFLYGQPKCVYFGFTHYGLQLCIMGLPRDFGGLCSIGIDYSCNKLLQIWRGLIESCSRHILFGSDSNSEIQKIFQWRRQEWKIKDIRYRIQWFLTRFCPSISISSHHTTQINFSEFDYSLSGL